MLQHCTVFHGLQVVSAFALTNKNDLIRDDYHKLMRAFKALDPEKKGFISAELFSNLLSSRGEAFSTAETGAMLRYVVNSMNIWWTAYVEPDTVLNARCYCSCASEAATGKVYYEDYAYKLATNGRKV